MNRLRAWRGLLAVVSFAGLVTAAEPAPLTYRITMPGSPLGAGWAFLYGYGGIKAEPYLPQLRSLGGGFTKIYLIWNQVEPEKGRYDWTAVDAFINQLKSPEEGLISIFASSTWATRRSSAVLPPSPAKDPADYARFIHDLVAHCKGRVRYWQNDSEPNSPIYWSGTKEEFVAELKLFYKAVKDADPKAVVVVGGYDGLFGPPGTHQMPNQQAGLNFFDYVIKEGRDSFDLFDLRLYADPYTIPARVEFMRRKMIAQGYERPIISTEYGGPGFYEFPENRKYVSLVMTWMQDIAKTGATGQAGGGNKITELYSQMSTLAPQTQIFMLGCTPELDAKYQRIQIRQLTMRNVLAFTAGVQKMLYWQFLDGHAERDNIMTLMYGKIGMVGYRDGVFGARTPTADGFARMAGALAGVQQVKRVDLPGGSSIFLFEVDRGKRGPVYVVWEQRDAFIGEEAPPVPVEWSWKGKRAVAVDALGAAVKTEVAGGRVHMPVGATPIYVERGH